MLTTLYSCQGEHFLQFIVAGGGLTYDTQRQKNLHDEGMPIIFSKKEIQSNAVRRIMADVFLDRKLARLEVIREHGDTLNARRYCDTVARRPELLRQPLYFQPNL